MANTPSKHPDPFANAIARHAHVKQKLSVMAGKMLSSDEVADRLDITLHEVEKQLQDGELLAVQSSENWLYPAFQFESEAIRDGIKKVLRSFDGHDSWWILDTLLARADTLGDRSLLDAIRDGSHKDVDRHIRQWQSDGYA
jgi:hypothetical protein